MRYFLTPIVLSLLAIGLFLGLTRDWDGFLIILFLAMLELSISFDNAIVNAKVLSKMDVHWRRLFFWVGLPIAIFGVRFALPFVLVAWTGPFSLMQAVQLAFHNPTQYEIEVLKNTHLLYAFGSGFLMWVGLSFIFQKRNLGESHIAWFKLEKSKGVRWLSNHKIILILFSCVVAFILTLDRVSFGLAFLLGFFLQQVFYYLGEWVSDKKLLSGLFLFIYLEILDASFSLDGVLGAFAFTTNPWVMMVGLGIGAIFVRALTLRLLDKKTLNHFVYLEHGAHYAIGFLGLVLFLEIFIAVPIVLTAFVSLGLIVKAFYDSWQRVSPS